MDVLVDAHTRLAALLGDPVEHSLSPLIHNTAFRAQSVNIAYVAFRVPARHVESAVKGLRALDFVGANVTAPHKQTVIPALDELSPQARAIGAVNTIIRREDGRLTGDNTDITGFLAPLLDVAAEIRGAPMVILGSGGAARAVAYALLSTFEPETLTIAARTPENAERLASDLAEHDTDGALRVENSSNNDDIVARSRLVVNATPVGTHPNTNETPISNPDALGPDHVVYDLVYNPEKTRLLHEADERRARTIGGLDMLVAQAAAAYVQWTGHEMPVDVVRSALRNRKTG